MTATNMQQILGEAVGGKTVILWGTGTAAELFAARYSNAIHRVIDSDTRKTGNVFHGICIESPDALAFANPSQSMLFVASMFWPDIVDTAAQFGFVRNQNCFIATNLTGIEPKIYRGYIKRNNVPAFLRDMAEAGTVRSSGFVLLRDIEVLLSGSRQSLATIGDIDLLLEDGLTDWFAQHTSPLKVADDSIGVDAEVHERFPACHQPYWFRPLAADLLSGSVLREGVPVPPPELEAHALAYHMLFHKGPEMYSAESGFQSKRLLHLSNLYGFSPCDEDWPRRAEAELRADGYWPPLDMRRAILKAIEGRAGRAPWLRTTCAPSDEDSSVHVVFIRSEERAVVQLVESELKRVNLVPRRWFRCTTGVCDRVRSGFWSESDEAFPARIAVVVHGRTPESELISSDQDFQTPQAYSLKYVIRSRLVQKGLAANLVHMPDDASETVECLGTLESFGQPL